MTDNLKRRVRMVCTVGTSLIGFIPKEKKQAKEKEILEHLYKPEEEIFSYAKAQKHIDGGREKAFKLLEEEYLPQDLNDPNTEYTFITAEVQTLIRWLSENRDELQSIHIILLPSKKTDSHITALATYIYINKAAHLFPKVKITCEKSDIILKDIEVETREEFLASVQTVFEEFDEQLNGNCQVRCRPKYKFSHNFFCFFTSAFEGGFSQTTSGSLKLRMPFVQRSGCFALAAS